MYQLLDPVETSLGPAKVVGLLPDLGMIEVRLIESRECFVVKPEHLESLVRKPMPWDDDLGPRPESPEATTVYVLADDIDQPLIEVVQAAEARARRLHDIEERRYRTVVGEE
jgi:hypothetical protein